MKTKRWDVTKQDQDLQIVIDEAVTLLKKGYTVALPTETVYGLGADATNPTAVNRIFKAKGRPQDNPLIAHVASKDQLLLLTSAIPLYAEKLIDTFSPGPITFVLPSNGVCAHNVTAGLDTIAVRIPDHPVAQKLITKFNKPLAAPSANISGKPSPTTADHVWQDLAGKISGLIDAGPTGFGMESTVIDCTKNIPVILRPGAITEEQIREVVGDVKTLQEKSVEHTKSPGTKYNHYMPDIPLWIVDGSPQYIQSIIDEELGKSNRIGLLASTQLIEKLTADEKFPLGNEQSEIVMNLYSGLRHFTSESVDLIICESFSDIGLGKALMNRITKAASKVITE